MTVMDDDGPGPHSASLFAGGSFTNIYANTSQSNSPRIARWNGAAWLSVDGGVSSMYGTAWVSCMSPIDGTPSQPGKLYFGGQFYMLGPYHGPENLACWNGTSIQPLSAGSGDVLAMCNYDPDRDGPLPLSIYVSTAQPFFGTVQGIGVTTIQPAGIQPAATVLTSFDLDGPGGNPPVLVAGGASVSPAVRWDGERWTALQGPHTPTGIANTLLEFDDDGPGPHPPVLMAGGGGSLYGSTSGFRFPPSQTAYHVIAWNGSDWSATGQASGAGNYTSVSALCAFAPDPAVPPRLYACGYFTQMQGVSAPSIASWDGAAWSGLPGAISGQVNALCVFDDDGDGPRPPALYVGGAFVMTTSRVPAHSIARWDGHRWEPLIDEVTGDEGIIAGSTQGRSGVVAMTVFDDDGPGPDPPALYVTGSFTGIGHSMFNNIARWDGHRWSTLGTGLQLAGFALSIFDEDGPGGAPPRLFVGGFFHMPGRKMARWNGTNWSTLESGLYSYPSTLFTFDDDGEGPHPASLWAGGTFTSAGGHPSYGIARWGSPYPYVGQSQPPRRGVVGQTATLHVETGGAPPLRFQWRKDGAILTDGGRVSGATTATLAIQNVDASDAGFYDLVVANGCGQAVSDAARLLVCTSTLRGDMTGDGRVDGDDIAPFVAALFNAAPSSTELCGADLSGDFVVSNGDVPLFIAALFGP